MPFGTRPASVYPASAFALSLELLPPTTTFVVDVTTTLILIPIQELFWLDFPTLHVIVYGVFLVGVIILMPEGLISRLKDYGLLPQSRGI